MTTVGFRVSVFLQYSDIFKFFHNEVIRGRVVTSRVLSDCRFAEERVAEELGAEERNSKVRFLN